MAARASVEVTLRGDVSRPSHAATSSVAAALPPNGRWRLWGSLATRADLSTGSCFDQRGAEEEGGGGGGECVCVCVCLTWCWEAGVGSAWDYLGYLWACPPLPTCGPVLLFLLLLQLTTYAKLTFRAHTLAHTHTCTHGSLRRVCTRAIHPPLS